MSYKKSMKMIQNKKKIVLISIYGYTSFGIRYIYTVLKSRNYDVFLIFLKDLEINNMEFPSEKEIDDLLKKIKDINPSLIGVSIITPVFEIAKFIINKIREHSDALIITGGIHAIIAPEQCIEFSDIVCIGEGENTIIQLVEKLEKSKDYSNIKNLWVKQGKKIIKNDRNNLIKNLDSLPLMDIENENKFYIENNKIKKGDPILNTFKYGLHTTRGCPYQCTYCSNNILRKIFNPKGSFIRKRSVDNVIEELVYAKKRYKSLKRVSIHDEVFGIDKDKQWLDNFLLQYKRRINLPFFVQLHPIQIKEDFIKKLKWSGLSYAIIGIQSGSQRIRENIYRRYTTNESIIKAAKVLKKYRVLSHYDLIVENPLETEQDLRESFELFLQIQRPFILRMFALNNFPKTELTKLLEKKGYIDVYKEQTKATKRWRVAPRHEGDERKRFWYSLILLTSKPLIPKTILRKMSKSKLWRKNLSYLNLFVGVSRITELMATAFDVIKRGELTPSLVIRYIRMAKRGFTY